MKRNGVVIPVLAVALGLSLWANLRPRTAAVPGAPATPADRTEAAPVKFAPAVEEMDFSETGLADEAWQLESGVPGEGIPDKIPGNAVEGILTEAPPRIPPDLEVGNSIRLTTGPEEADPGAPPPDARARPR